MGVNAFFSQTRYVPEADFGLVPKADAVDAGAYQMTKSLIESGDHSSNLSKISPPHTFQWSV